MRHGSLHPARHEPADTIRPRREHAEPVGSDVRAHPPAPAVLPSVRPVHVAFRGLARGQRSPWAPRASVAGAVTEAAHDPRPRSPRSAESSRRDWRVGRSPPSFGLHPARCGGAATDPVRAALTGPAQRASTLSAVPEATRRSLALRATRLYEMVRSAVPGLSRLAPPRVRSWRPRRRPLLYPTKPADASRAKSIGELAVTIGRRHPATVAFVLVLSWSRALHALFTVDQSLEVPRGQVAAPGPAGVPGSSSTIICAAPSRAQGDAVRFHPRSSILCGHYHCVPPCAVGAAWEKGRVERPCVPPGRVLSRPGRSAT